MKTNIDSVLMVIMSLVVISAMSVLLSLPLASVESDVASIVANRTQTLASNSK